MPQGDANRRLTEGRKAVRLAIRLDFLLNLGIKLQRQVEEAGVNEQFQARI